MLGIPPRIIPWWLVGVFLVWGQGFGNEILSADLEPWSRNMPTEKKSFN